ncbi:class I SAM-dependent methyltransferase [Nonomuraea sp. NPDC000554]|uniref:class I SAM-dependent methyltransferase n=1 Tax=Nonomuraea sp. NPDC000554 TaxID=3154259 RepID=UPI00332BD1E5
MPKVRLTGEQATMLATLYCRALDARSPRPLLNDTMALDAIEQLDFDAAATGVRRGDHIIFALRGRHLDSWTREFLASHPAATVLHLGCGLDSRVYRVAPGPGVRWFDVDYPEVIDLRQQLYPPRDGYQTIASSVTDPAWLADVPADLPVLVVAEGLTMYLEEAEGRALFRRIADRFPHGQFVFDAFSTRGIKLQKINKIVRAAGATLRWGVDGCSDLESIAPGLRCASAVGLFDIDGYDELGAGYRTLVRAARLLPFMRRMSVFYRLEF